MSTIRHLIAILALLASGLAFAAEPVDINTADARALAEAMPGVGLKRAEAIVAYRAENGPFKAVDELVAVKGVGPKILEKGRANLTVGASR